MVLCLDFLNLDFLNLDSLNLGFLNFDSLNPDSLNLVFDLHLVFDRSPSFSPYLGIGFVGFKRRISMLFRASLDCGFKRYAFL